MERVIYLNDINWGKVTLDSENGFNFVNFSPVHAVNITIKSHGTIPYVTRTALNNGISGFVEAIDIDNNKINSGNCISFGGETGCFFYQLVDFIAGNNMHGIYHKNLSKKSALILIAILNKTFSNIYSYGYAMIPSRIEGTKINVPVTSNNEIDFKVLEEIYDETIKEIPNISKTTNQLTNGTISLNDRKWHQFVIEDILDVNNGVRLTKENMIDGNTPFIGATSKNNGITNWVSNTNKSLNSNVLGVNYNGSVVDNFYHPYHAIFSDDVKRIHIKNQSVGANVYKYLFLKTVFLQHKNQYQYGYKFDSNRMKKQKITLPVNNDGNPDWQFMEDYIKSLPNGDLI